MGMTKLSCSNCGASYLVESAPGKYSCEYCGAAYLIEVDAGTGRLASAKVTGSMIDDGQVYAVHNLLRVTGSMNDIVLLDTAPNAKHVGTLEVEGSMNDVFAILLDGAACEIKGSMNDVKRRKS